MTMDAEEEHVYLVLFGAPSGAVRTIRHIGIERDGVMVPRCNTHYVASHDSQPRRFRPVKNEAEASLRVCKRCLAWNPSAWKW